MIPDQSLHPNYLKAVRAVSDGMLKITENERFLKWVSKQLLDDLNPSHISVALYDPFRDSFPVRVSSGSSRIPPSLVELNRRSALVQWFEKNGPMVSSPGRSHHLITFHDLKSSHVPLSEAVQRELIIHHSEICAKIQAHNRSAGYLLVGNRKDSHPYTREELTFVRILANDIAIEIEREEYFHLSQLDPLTGLYNRNSLDVKLPEMMKRSRESDTLLGVALIDLDNFKQINDRYGHPAGDEVLRTATQTIREGIRKVDLAFRYGGEEILILLHLVLRNPDEPPNGVPKKRAQVYQILERLRRQIASRALMIDGQKIGVTISAGISVYNGEVLRTPEDLLREADLALYQSKRKGKNRVTVYAPPGVTP